jgi:bifunctional DNA-binding transcriptional regulator/antitoxin component of YhaV-PrlF toxin-antitoxin module
VTAVKTTVGARGRVTVPAAVQRDSGVLEGDEVVVRSAGPGIVIVESVKAIKDRIRAGAPEPGGHRYDAVAEIRAARDHDSAMSAGGHTDDPEPGLPRGGPGDEDPGAEMLRSLGL